MAINTRRFKATPEQVWGVLADGWLYPLWVVGASRMREVDDTWPAVGSKLHHSVGTWPALLDDTTEVVESTPASRRTRSAAPRLLPKPVRDVQLKWRNSESLRRLAYVVERRSAGRTSAS